MTPSEQIDQQIAEAAGWQRGMLTDLRRLIHEADPEIAEDWKWSTAVFAHKGNVCAISPFKDKVKINFFKGASLKDPNKLFNAGLDAKATRAIDFSAGDALDEGNLKELIKEAVELNVAGGK